MRPLDKNKKIILIFVSLFALAGVSSLLFSKAASYSLLSAMEGESLVYPSAVAKVITDSSASGGKALEFLNNASATSTSFTLTDTAVQIQAQVRATTCRGNPQLVIKVDGKTQGGPISVGNSAWASYYVDTTVAAGTHTLTVSYVNDFQKKNCNRNLFLDKISLYALTPVPTDITAPSVSFTNPLNGATLSGTTTIAVTASDNVGITKTEFYVDNVLSATSTSAPYSFVWNTGGVANGTHELVVRSYDAAGNVGTGNIKVNVSNTVTPTSGILQGPVKGITGNWQGWGESAEMAAEIRNFGASWVREDFEWSRIESTKGYYNWTDTDTLISRAKAEGLRVLPILETFPAWVKASDPTAIGDYSKFVAAVVARYGPGTSANLPVFEIWNEPYLLNSWGSTPDARVYSHFYVSAVKAARAVNPNAKFLISGEFTDWAMAGTSNYLTVWVDDLFVGEPTIGQYIDGATHHSYGGDPLEPRSTTTPWKGANTGSLSVQRIDVVRQKFQSHGVDVPFWITEMGWHTETIGEQTAGQYYTNFSSFLAARPWVRGVFPFTLREFNGNGTSEPEFGLLNWSTWTPKGDYAPAKQMLTNFR